MPPRYDESWEKWYYLSTLGRIRPYSAESVDVVTRTEAEADALQQEVETERTALLITGPQIKCSLVGWRLVCEPPPASPTASTPGEVPWVEFLHAMATTGFVPEKLDGFVWSFRPTGLDVERSTQIHEPQPSGKIKSGAGSKEAACEGGWGVLSWEARWPFYSSVLRRW